MTALRWTDLPAPELSAAQLHDLLALRCRVFVVEQACAYQDIDGLDLLPSTRHLWATSQTGEAAGELAGAMVAYARLLGPEESGPHLNTARIGRVVVDPSVRGQRLGVQLMTRALESCRAAWPTASVALAAQAHLQAFYGSLGFVPTSEVYDEDGIPHVDMELRARHGRTSPPGRHRSGVYKP